MTHDPYQTAEGVRWSELKVLGRSPRHYRHRLDNEERPDTIYLRLGRFVHALILEPELADEQYVVFDGKVRRGKAFEAFKAELEDEPEILLESEYRNGVDMAAAVLDDPVAREALHGAKETPVFWTDEKTGLLCKAKPDAVNGRICDLKTANSDAYGPDRFWRQARRLGYHGQLAHYKAGLEANGYVADDEPAFVVVESVPPYDVAVYRAPPAMIAEGESLRRSLLDQLAWCLDHDLWMGATAGQETELYWPEPLDGGVTFGGQAI